MKHIAHVRNLEIYQMIFSECPEAHLDIKNLVLLRDSVYHKDNPDVRELRYQGIT